MHFGSNRALYRACVFVFLFPYTSLLVAGFRTTNASTFTSGPLLSMAIGSSLNFTSDNQNLYRPSQLTLDVEKYPLPPQGLQLEQVHVYVRHGGPFDSLGKERTANGTCRRTHTCRCETRRSSSEYPGALDNVQDSADVQCHGLRDVG